MNASLTAWWLVAVSVIAEVGGTVALKHSDGLTRTFTAGAAVACYGLAIWLMAVAMRQLDMGITYAVWAASGTAATALLGYLVFEEPMGATKAAGLVCVVVGVVLLNLGERA